MIKRIYEFSKNRPRTFWSIVGMTAGVIVGLFIGGIGIAALGGAVGISAGYVSLFAAAVGAYFGHRVGGAVDNRAGKKNN